MESIRNILNSYQFANIWLTYKEKSRNFKNIVNWYYDTLGTDNVKQFAHTENLERILLILI
jgi:hypothetical protein